MATANIVQFATAECEISCGQTDERTDCGLHDPPGGDKDSTNFNQVYFLSVYNTYFGT